MSRRVAALGIMVLVALSSCTRKQEDPAGAQPTPSSTTSASATASASAKPVAPWYVGQWQGEYDARHYLIEMPKEEGSLAEWGKDAGKQHSGKGTISVSVAVDGGVTGSARGPLGDQIVSGSMEGDSLRLRLSPRQATGAEAFSGFLLAERQQDKLAGSLQASSGDSLSVRDAPVQLAKVGGSP